MALAGQESDINGKQMDKILSTTLMQTEGSKPVFYSGKVRSENRLLLLPATLTIKEQRNQYQAELRRQ